MRKANHPPPKRRYLVHLFCIHDENIDPCRYCARTRPWASRVTNRIEAQERTFRDQCDLVETVNPLLPRGSDVRDVLTHIESADGFLYLLHLSSEEADHLGWHE